MKPSLRLLLVLALALLGAGSFPSARAATATKAASGTDLNAGASWTGAATPTATDVATWNSLSLGAGLTLGANTNWLGLSASGALTDISITGAGTLTLGNAGINLSGSTVNLSIANSIVAGTNQSWLANGGKGITNSGGLSGAYGLSAGGLTYWSFLPASAATILNGVSLANVVSAGGMMGGSSIGTPVTATTYFFNNNGTVATYQMQIYDGTYTKCVKVQLAQSGSDITGYAVYAKYNSGNTLGYNFDNGGTGNTVSTSGSAGGYGAALTILSLGTTYSASYLPASPTTVTVFSNTSLANVTSVAGAMGGGYVSGTPAAATAFFFTNNVTNATFQLQAYDGGHTKSVKVQLTQSGADIIGTVLYARYDSTAANTLGTNFDTISGNVTAGTIATSAAAGGYGAGSITIGTGSGTVTLSGTNTYTGPTLIAAGTLAIGGAGSLGSGNYTAAITNNAALLYNSTATQTLSGIIVGPGTLTQAGPGTLILTTNNSFTGKVTVNGGTLRSTVGNIAGNTGFGINNTVTANAGGTVDISGVNGTAGQVGASALNTMVANGGTVNFSLSGANPQDGPYMGIFNLTNGIVTNTTTSGPRWGYSQASGVINVGGTSSTWYAPVWFVSGAGKSVTVNAAGNLTMAGVIADYPALTGLPFIKTGVGTLTLAAANTYAGVTTNSQGTINLTASGTLGTGAVFLNDANTGANNTALLSDRTAGVTIANAITVANQGTGTSTIGTSGGSGNFLAYSATVTLNKNVILQGKSADRTTFSGKITGTGNVTIDGGGTTDGRVTLDYNGNDFAGNVTVNPNAVLQFNSTNAIPDASFMTNNGKIFFNAVSEAINGLVGTGVVQVHPSVTANSTLIVGMANGFGSFTGTMQNGPAASTLALTKSGSSTQELVGANIKYTGATAVTNGLLRLLECTNFASSGITITPPGQLEFSNTTICAAPSALSGTGTLLKSGAGTLAIGGALTYSGTATVTNGSLRLINVTAFTSSGVALNTGTGLELSNTVPGIFNAPISGAGSLTKSGPEAVVLSTTHTYSGPTMINGGKLYANGALNAASVVSVAANATFGGQGSAGTVTVAAGGAIEGGQGGTGALTLGSLSFAGNGSIGVTVAAGTTPLVVSGTLTNAPSAASPIMITILNGTQPAAGTYHIVQWGALAGTAGFALPLNRIYTLQTNGNYLDLVVSASSDFPVWTGSYSSEWSVNNITSPKNWKLNSDGSATDFLSADNVWFDDSAPGTTNVDISVADISPTQITFSNANLSYTLQGTRGMISGSLLKQGSGLLTISNANAYTAGTIISNGAITFVNGGLGSAGAIRFGGNSTLRWLGHNQDLSTRLAIDAGVTATLDTMTNAVTFAAGFGGGGSGSLTKAGTGTLTLTGAATYSGTTTVTNGTFQIGNGGGAGSIASGPVAIGGSGTLQFNYGNYGQVYNNNISGTGTLLILGNQDPQFAGDNSGFTGPVVVQGTNAQFRTRSATAWSGVSSVTVSNGGMISVFNYANNFDIKVGSLWGNGTVRLGSSGNNGLILGGNNQDATFTGAILNDAGGAGFLTKIGTGIQTLTGANTYSGATTVSNGLLRVNGSLAAASVVTVVTNGTLGGNGTINGPITVQLGGTLQPGLGGTNTSTLTVNNTLTLAGNTMLAINRTNAQNSSRVMGVTTLTAGGTLTVSNIGPALQLGDSFALLGAASRNGTFALTNLPSLDAGLVWATADNYGSITVMATVPPVFTLDPISRGVLPGNTVRFTAAALGAPPVAFQWLSNGVPVPDATSLSLVFANVQPDQAASYRIMATNPYGSSTSAVAVLTVLGANTNLFPGAVKTDQPFAYWRLGETSGTIAYDALGTNDGTYVNVTLGQPGALLGDADKSAGFSPASSSHVVIPNASAFNFVGTPTFTLEAWARFDNFSGVMRIFSNRGGSGYGFGLETSNSLRFTAFGVLDVHQAIGTNLLAGQYYHLVAVITNGTVQFYFNGQPVGGANTFGNINTSTAPLWLGMNPTTTAPETMAGLIDEAAVYTNALPASRVLAHYLAGLNSAPVIAQQPQSLVVTRWQPASLSVTLSQGTAPAYQWYFSNDVSAPNFLALSGANSATLAMPITDLTNTGSYCVTVSNVVASVTSAVATLTVNIDSEPPAPLSAGSLNGFDIGIAFNKPVNPATLSVDMFSVTCGGAQFYLNNASLLPDGRTVRLDVDGYLTGPFTVEASYVENLDGISSADSSSVDGQVLAPKDLSTNVGPGLGSTDPLYVGTALNATNANWIEVLAGGSDIAGTNDAMQFVYQSFTNDFVATVRVASLQRTDPWAKAGLMARPSLAANSQNIAALATPALADGGAGVFTMLARATNGTATVELSRTAEFATNWLKLRRTANAFFTYSSSNGVDWIALATNTPLPAYPATVLVGLATTAHTNAADVFAKAEYDGFNVVAPVVITTPPQTATVSEGDPVALSVIATGTTSPLLYQWQMNGVDFPERPPARSPSTRWPPPTKPATASA